MIKLQLHENWQLCNIRQLDWIPAQIPGDIYAALLKTGKMPDPFFGDNEYQAKALMEEDYEYRTVFNYEEAQFKDCQEVILRFDGIDTIADIYLNGCCLGKVDNMHRIWEFPVGELLENGKNTLRVIIRSPLKFMAETFKKYKNRGNEDTIEGFMHLRKAHYMCGWDWGACLPDGGIFRPVTLLGIETARLDSVYIRQVHKDGKVLLVPEVDVETVDEEESEADGYEGAQALEYQVTVTAPNGTKTIWDDCPDEMEIENPQLWWPNGLGEQPLYQVQVDLKAGDKIVDTWCRKIGLRALTMHREKDQWGESFAHEVNGYQVFAMGADYIPEDNLLQRTSRERTRELLLQCKRANFNTVRVWGGGYYPEDWFFDLCDELGLMVWQDFMFACSMYPAEGALLDNIHQEAVDNVKRLRNHACIALWCGNNECQDAWLGWGWKCEIERQNKEYADKIWAQYRQQYHVTLPGVVREYAPGTFYWPSSPFAFEGEMSGTTDGDRHYWSVWHGKAPISDYDSEKSRFFSEYGFQSFPEFDSVKRYAPYPEDWDIRSEVMMSHQRGGDHANGLIETYLLNEYKKPRDFRAFLYMNHVLQGDAIKTAIESHRRQMPYNMGTLFWQHNDCWPVASWASRDYYGRWKAQHYYTRKVYDDILISPVVEGDDLKVYAVSDRLENTSGRLQLQVCRFDGTVVYHWDKSVGISGNDSRVCFSAPLAKLLEGADRGTVYVRVDYTDKSGRVYHNNYCLDKQKNMNYPKVDLQTEVRSIEGGYEVTVSTDKFARAVCLSVADNESVYSDNYFDVQPKSSVQVQVRTRLSAEAFNASLRLTCLNNEF